MRFEKIIEQFHVQFVIFHDKDALLHLFSLFTLGASFRPAGFNFAARWIALIRCPLLCLRRLSAGSTKSIAITANKLEGPRRRMPLLGDPPHAGSRSVQAGST
jgi:hypothetical protein